MLLPPPQPPRFVTTSSANLGWWTRSSWSDILIDPIWCTAFCPKTAQPTALLPPWNVTVERGPLCIAAADPKPNGTPSRCANVAWTRAITTRAWTRRPESVCSARSKTSVWMWCVQRWLLVWGSIGPMCAALFMLLCPRPSSSTNKKPVGRDEMAWRPSVSSCIPRAMWCAGKNLSTAKPRNPVTKPMLHVAIII